MLTRFLCPPLSMETRVLARSVSSRMLMTSSIRAFRWALLTLRGMRSKAA